MFPCWVYVIEFGFMSCGTDMGFAEDDVRKALRIARNDVNVAMDILMSY